MTRQEIPPLRTLSGAVLEAQWDQVGQFYITGPLHKAGGPRKKEKTAMSHSQESTIAPPVLRLDDIFHQPPKRQLSLRKQRKGMVSL